MVLVFLSFLKPLVFGLQANGHWPWKLNQFT